MLTRSFQGGKIQGPIPGLDGHVHRSIQDRSQVLRQFDVWKLASTLLAVTGRIRPEVSNFFLSLSLSCFLSVRLSFFLSSFSLPPSFYFFEVGTRSTELALFARAR